MQNAEMTKKAKYWNKKQTFQQNKRSILIKSKKDIYYRY